MIRHQLIKILLMPLSLLYGIGISIRDLLYRLRILRSISFAIPVIGIGNLSVGGAGKTPHTEYLIRLLSPYMPIAVLSRGYKRKSSGFRIVGPEDSSLTVGDEPYQYFLKYRGTTVAVSESRSIGIPRLLTHRPDTQAILLDDSYQHRSVRPGLNILLTEHAHPYSKDILLPAGRLREWRSAADRADIIIVTKCPPDADAGAFLSEINPQERQKIFFTTYEYFDPYSFLDGQRINLSSEGPKDIILLTAIANEEYLEEYLDRLGHHVYPMSYEDHHEYSPHEVSLLNLKYENLESADKIIITTEKDAVRLMHHVPFIKEKKLPIYVLPITVSFLFDQKNEFDSIVKEFLLNFKV